MDFILYEGNKIPLSELRKFEEELGHSIIKKSRRVISKSQSYFGVDEYKWYHILLLPFAFILELFKAPEYVLLEEVRLRVRNELIVIPEGFIWDLSSVPRILWWLLPPDGDFELASLVHDYIYKTTVIKRKTGDIIMFIISKYTNGSEKRMVWSDWDNWLRYAFVRLFGWIYYYNVMDFFKFKK